MSAYGWDDRKSPDHQILLVLVLLPPPLLQLFEHFGALLAERAGSTTHWRSLMPSAARTSSAAAIISWRVGTLILLGCQAKEIE
jgi:hypothetical protein